jgi:pre-mRNA-splicing factor ATP-dependent RNA helicase DHX15/PRP43
MKKDEKSNHKRRETEAFINVFESSPHINPFTKKPYSPRYYAILEKRKELPAWEARNKVVELINQY